MSLALQGKKLDENAVKTTELPHIEVFDLVQTMNFLVNNITEKGKLDFFNIYSILRDREIIIYDNHMDIVFDAIKNRDIKDKILSLVKKGKASFINQESKEKLERKVDVDYSNNGIKCIKFEDYVRIDETEKGNIKNFEEEFEVDFEKCSCSSSVLKKLLKREGKLNCSEDEKQLIQFDWKNAKLSEFLDFNCLNTKNREFLKKYNEAFGKIDVPQGNNNNSEFKFLSNSSRDLVL